MKIRIQRNSVRLRLSKREVEQLAETGTVTETTSFGTSIFSYSVESSSVQDTLSATFGNGKITMFVPSDYLEDWVINDITGFDATIAVDGNPGLYLLLEKDFKCLDNTTEDQSDHYENPKKSC